MAFPRRGLPTTLFVRPRLFRLLLLATLLLLHTLGALHGCVGSALTYSSSSSSSSSPSCAAADSIGANSISAFTALDVEMQQLDGHGPLVALLDAAENVLSQGDAPSALFLADAAMSREATAATATAANDMASAARTLRRRAIAAVAHASAFAGFDEGDLDGALSAARMLGLSSDATGYRLTVARVYNTWQAHRDDQDAQMLNSFPSAMLQWLQQTASLLSHLWDTWQLDAAGKVADYGMTLIPEATRLADSSSGRGATDMRLAVAKLLSYSVRVRVAFGGQVAAAAATAIQRMLSDVVDSDRSLLDDDPVLRQTFLNNVGQGALDTWRLRSNATRTSDDVSRAADSNNTTAATLFSRRQQYSTTTCMTRVEAVAAAEQKCDLDRRDMTNMTQEAFFREYVDTGRPVLLSNFWDKTGWNVTRWNLQGLRRNAALNASRVTVTQSRWVTIRQNLLYDAPLSAGSRVTTLGEFLQLVVKQKQNGDGGGGSSGDPGCDPEYLFAPLSEAALHAFFDADDADGDGADDDDLNCILGRATSMFESAGRYARGRQEWAEAALFYVGPPGSGASWHKHTNAINVMAQGTKRWFLLPPGLNYISAGGTSVLEWVEELGSVGNMPFPPLECTQQAGDAFYVPSGWSHAVLNLETSVGFAVELGEDVDLRTWH